MIPARTCAELSDAPRTMAEIIPNINSPVPMKAVAIGICHSSGSCRLRQIHSVSAVTGNSAAPTETRLATVAMRTMN